MSQQIEGRCLKDPRFPCPNPTARQQGCENAPSTSAIEMFFPAPLQSTYRKRFESGPSATCYQEQQGNIKP